LTDSEKLFFDVIKKPVSSIAKRALYVMYLVIAEEEFILWWA